jgi:hypothetical protein
MALQITLGTGLLLVNIILAAVSALILETVFTRSHAWLIREPHGPKLVLVVAGVSLFTLAVITVGLWIWAVAYQALGAFPDLETAVYFSSVCYTTLGFGDHLLPKDWQILAGMEAANGFLNFGLLTALLIEGLRQIRIRQVESRRGRSG